MHINSEDPKKEKVYCRILPVLEFKRNDDLYIFGSSDGGYRLPAIPALTAYVEIDKLLARQRDLELEWENDPDRIIRESLEERIPGISVLDWEEDVHTPFTYDDEKHCWTRDIVIRVDYEGQLPEEFEPGADLISAEPFYDNISLLRKNKKPRKFIKT